MKLLLKVFLLLISFNLTYGQQTWIRTYGGSAWDFGYSVQQTADGNYIVAGRTMSAGAGGEDVYLIKIDANGDTIWSKTYGGGDSDGATWVEQTADGGYIVVGRTWSFGIAGSIDIWLLRTDSLGDTLWAKTYGNAYEDWGYCVQQTLDGGYIIVGYQENAAGIGDALLMKTDSAGNLIWQKLYGGPNHDEASSVRQTIDGGYVIVGTYDYNTANAQVYLIKTNDLGDTIWTKKYGSSEADYGMDVIENSNGEYVIVGKSTRGALAGEAYLLTVDSNGVLLWEKIYGGSMDDWAHSIVQTLDGGYLLGGSDAQPPSGYNTLWLLKTDPMGDTVWTKRFTENSYALAVQQTQDNGYIAAGSIYSSGTGYDVYVIKTDPNGNAGIEESQKTVSENYRAKITTKPNPFVSFTVVQNYEQEVFLIYDTQGRLVGKSIGNRVGDNLIPGIYFLMPIARDITPLQVIKIK